MGIKLTSHRKDDIVDEDLDKFETEVRHRPHSVQRLTRVTGLGRKEVQLFYRGFKEACPHGVIDLAQFQERFLQWFPRSGRLQYAEFVFNTFDRNHDGYINFEEFLIGFAVLSRGDVETRLRWVFRLYDLNGDGVLTEDEMAQMVIAVYEMLGGHSQPPWTLADCRRHAASVFAKLDTGRNGKVTWEQFHAACQKDKTVLRSLRAFDTVLHRSVAKLTISMDEDGDDWLIEK